jgi:hypothetical protein
MNRSPVHRTSVAALRPWPFGPPLRGRAPRSDAGPPAAPGQRAPAPAQSNGARSRRQALAPAGGLAWLQPIHAVQR